MGWYSYSRLVGMFQTGNFPVKCFPRPRIQRLRLLPPAADWRQMVTVECVDGVVRATLLRDLRAVVSQCGERLMEGPTTIPPILLIRLAREDLCGSHWKESAPFGPWLRHELRDDIGGTHTYPRPQQSTLGGRSRPAQRSSSGVRLG
jgi:hypothetical protein